MLQLGSGLRTLGTYMGGQSCALCQGPKSKHTAASACVVSVLCFYIYIYIYLILLKKKEKESF